MPDISKIRLPGSNTDYDIKDAVAREAIAGGVSFIIVWTAADWASSTAPDSAKLATIPDGVVVYYDEGEHSAEGTLSAETTGSGTHAQPGAFYLIYSNTQASESSEQNDGFDRFDEYVPVGTTGSKTWEKIGDTQISLNNVVTGVSLSKQTDVVLGEGTTFANSSSSVSFNGGATDKVLGEDTTFNCTTPTITVTPSTTNIKATASSGGAAWNSKDQKTVVTGYTIAAANKDTFVKSVTAETGKSLVTTSIVPTNGTESVSKVTKTASKLVTTTIPNVTGNSNVTVPVVSSNSSVTANKSNWTFTMGDTAETSETLIIGGGNGSDVTATNTAFGTSTTASKVTLGTAITAATGAVASTGTGSDIVTAVSISDKTVAKAGSAVTVATGATSTTGTGDAVVTGVTVGDSADAIISLPSPSTVNVIGASSTFTNTQPTIQLATGATAGTGVISVATGITSAGSTTPTVTANKNDVVTAVTQVGAGTAAAQTITIGTNDKVTVLKSNTDVNVTKGNA